MRTERGACPLNGELCAVNINSCVAWSRGPGTDHGDPARGTSKGRLERLLGTGPRFDHSPAFSPLVDALRYGVMRDRTVTGQNNPTRRRTVAAVVIKSMSKRR